jgi:ACS family pantothenate transporter-like MFS transporter
MFAGLMMTAMHETMEGRAGLKGWQWVFVIGNQLRLFSLDLF